MPQTPQKSMLKQHRKLSCLFTYYEVMSYLTNLHLGRLSRKWHIACTKRRLFSILEHVSLKGALHTWSLQAWECGGRSWTWTWYIQPHTCWLSTHLHSGMVQAPGLAVCLSTHSSLEDCSAEGRWGFIRHSTMRSVHPNWHLNSMANIHLWNKLFY